MRGRGHAAAIPTWRPMELKTIGGYLAELRRHLSGRLPPEKVADVLRETQQHLAESAQGFAKSASALSEDAAARSFGTPKAVAKALLARAPARYGISILVPVAVILI